VRRGSLPAPDAYKLELPKDFQMPVGSGEWKWDDKDPLLGQARTLAHELGIPQEGFSRLLGLYVASKTGDAAEFKAATEAEIGKLGANSSARVDAVTRWMDAHGFKEMPKMLVTAGMVREFEGLITKLSSQGAAPFSQANRDPAGGQRLSNEEWSKLTYAQRQEYARKFPQQPSDRGRHPTAA